MTKCPSRYLTADGRVLDCVALFRAPSYVAHAPYPHDGGTVFWQPDDPNVYDATCTTCEGYGIVPRASMAVMGDGSPVPKGNTCQTCGGTGVDETIPRRLVGVGSRLSREDRTDLIIVGKMDDIAFCVEPDGHGHQLIELADIGRVWQVVRAVPPAHTTTTTNKDTP